VGCPRNYPQRDLSDLIREAQAAGPDDQAAIGEIIRRFEPLTRKLGRGLAASGAYRDDIENAARLALTRAVGRHKGAIETFPAYAKRYMTGAARRELGQWLPPTGYALVALDELSAITTMPKVVPVEDLADHHGFGHGDTADAIVMLEPARRHLLRRRHIDDAELAEIAAECGTSVPAVSQRLCTIHRRLHAKLAA